METQTNAAPEGGAKAPEAPMLNIDSNSELHKIRTALELVIAGHNEFKRELPNLVTTESLAKFTPQIDNMGRKLDEIEARVKWLDEHQPRGGKTYTADPFGDFESKREARLRSMGKWFSVAAAVEEGARSLPDGFEYRAATAGTDTAGGVYAPIETINDTIRIIKEQSIARQRARYILAPNQRQVEIPTVVSGLTAEFPGEGSAPSGSDVVYASKANSRLTLDECVVYTSVSQQLRGTALEAFEPVLAELFAEAIAAKENAALFSMSSPFTGIVQTSGIGNWNLGGSTTSGKTHYSAVTFADLVNTLNQVASNCRGNAEWVMHPDIFIYPMLLTDTQGNPIYGTNYADGFFNHPVPSPVTNAPARLLGKPCWFTEQMPNTNAVSKIFAIVGDMKKAVFVDGLNMGLRFDDSVLFKERMRAIMFFEMFATKVMVASAFAGAKVAAS